MDILRDFGFSRRRDEESGRILSDLLKSRPSPSKIFAEALSLVYNSSVTVCGNAPSLAAELSDFVRSPRRCTFIAADGATSVLLRAGINPEIIVTDLDGNMDDILQANKIGSLIVVHAHGDNLDKLREFVPQLGNVIGTTQSRPPFGLYNFGGFTDGDRCVFLARHLGASEIELIGFDFEDESVTTRKREKLGWAKRLIALALADESSC